jgi:magnesium-transporting ATPase (P-type)
VKGAPEAVLPRCAGDCGPWPALVEQAAARGLRLIAIAAADRPAEQRVLRFEDVTGLTLQGLVALIDAPRAEAVEAVALCHGAGIAVAMITGDHAGTALAIAREVGIDTAAGALTGAALEAMDDAALAAAVARVRVFARVAPAHKLRLVSALQASGAVVAMTGDGVNDAPALKRADIGVAMGRSGSEAAKEAAEIVLADDNFATIAAAVREGRAVYDNLTKTILMMLPTSAGEALVVMAAVLLGTAMPVTAVQILWVNLITAVLLNLALVFEKPERDVMTRPPRNPRAPILSPFLVRRTVFVSVLMGAATFAVFQIELARGSGLAAARGAAVTALVMMEAAYLLNTRHLVASCMTVEGVTGSPFVLGAIALVMALQVLFVALPPAQAVFGVAMPDAVAWGIITAVSVALFLTVEAEKALLRR